MTRWALWSHYPKCRGGNLPPVIEAFTVIGWIYNICHRNITAVCFKADIVGKGVILSARILHFVQNDTGKSAVAVTFVSPSVKTSFCHLPHQMEAGSVQNDGYSVWIFCAATFGVFPWLRERKSILDSSLGMTRLALWSQHLKYRVDNGFRTKKPGEFSRSPGRII